MKKYFLGENSSQGNAVGKGSGKKGFYIALLLLATAIGVSGYYANRERSIGDSANTAVNSIQSPQATQTVAPKLTPLPIKANSTAQTTGQASKPSSNNSSNKMDGDEKKPVAALAKVSKPQFSVPVEGIPILPYSPDKLIFSKTYDDWRIHNGIDIAAAQGTQVKAVADGIVEKVYRDDKLGITIIVSHGDVKSLCSGLSTDSMVRVGQQVKHGDIISGIGASPPGESALEPHLHFELIEGGVRINPAKYLAYAGSN